MESNQLIQLSAEQLEELLGKAAEIGANAGITRYQNEQKMSRKKKSDKRLRNTKLLLRNFRMLEMNAENSVFGRSQMGESAADILDDMMNLYNDQLIVDSIRDSATRTAIIIAHVRNMLEIYEICCERSSNELDIRRYDVLDKLYISDEAVSRKELAKKWGVSSDTTYADEKIAIERLSALIFGVDGLSVQ